MKKIVFTLFLVASLFVANPIRADSLAVHLTTVNDSLRFDSSHVAVQETTIVQGNSFVHISTDNIPPLFYKELPNKTGGTIGTFLWSLIGVAMYFFLKWHEKKGRDKSVGINEPFEIGIWLKDNIIFLLLYTTAFAFLYWNAGSMHPLAAIAIGMASPQLIDTLKKKYGSS